MKKIILLLLLTGILQAQYNKVFLRIETNVKHARVHIYENAINSTLYEQIKAGEIKMDEADISTVNVKHFTTPVPSILINSNQIIRIVLEKKGYKTFDEFVKVGNKDLKVDASKFKPKSKIALFFKNMVIPGWGQFHTDRGGAGLGFIALETLILGGTGYLYYDKEKHYDNFIDLRNQYEVTSDPVLYKELAKEMDEEKDLYEKEHQYFNYALYAAGAVWLWAMLDGFINAPGPNDRYTVNLKLDQWNKKYYATINIKF